MGGTSVEFSSPDCLFFLLAVNFVHWWSAILIIFALFSLAFSLSIYLSLYLSLSLLLYHVFFFPFYPPNFLSAFYRWRWDIRTNLENVSTKAIYSDLLLLIVLFFSASLLPPYPHPHPFPLQSPSSYYPSKMISFYESPIFTDSPISCSLISNNFPTLTAYLTLQTRYHNNSTISILLAFIPPHITSSPPKAGLPARIQTTNKSRTLLHSAFHPRRPPSSPLKHPKCCLPET